MNAHNASAEKNYDGDLNDSMRTLSISSTSMNISGSSTKSDPEYFPDEIEKSMLVPSKLPSIPESLSALDFSGVCMVADRLNLSLEGTALMTNSIFEMAGLITNECKKLVVTGQHFQKRLADTRQETWRNDLEHRSRNVEHIQCFSFDGKRSDTAVILETPHNKNATMRGFKRMENVAVMEHPQLEPLGFVSSLNGSSYYIFQKLWKFLNPGGTKTFESLVAIAADGTNSDTGHEGGVIALFEKAIGRNLHRIICLLHLNELGMKYMITVIDGPTLSESKLSGPIGKKITDNNFFVTHIAAFNTIALGEISANIKGITTSSRGDQRQLLDLGHAIASGNCPESIVSRKPPPFSFCRWTSAAIRIQLAYISDDQPSHNLVTVATFVQQVYIPMWLRIRSQCTWDHGSRHVFALLDLSRKAAETCQNNKLIRVMRTVILNNGWFAHSENIMLSMLADADSEIRKTAYSNILKIREKRLSDGKRYDVLRTFKKPQADHFNFSATNYSELLKADYFVYEPPFTQMMSQKMLEEHASANIQINVPAFKCHTQDTERIVAVMNSWVGRITGEEHQNAVMSHKIITRKVNPRNVKSSYRTHEEMKLLRRRKIQNRTIEKRPQSTY